MKILRQIESIGVLVSLSLLGPQIGWAFESADRLEVISENAIISSRPGDPPLFFAPKGAFLRLKPATAPFEDNLTKYYPVDLKPDQFGGHSLGWIDGKSVTVHRQNPISSWSQPFLPFMDRATVKR